MKYRSNVFFKPHIGKNQNGLFVLLATPPCIHKNDCPYFDRCTRGKSREFNELCPFREEATDGSGRLIKLEENTEFIIEKHIRDLYWEYGEKRNATMTKLTNILSEVFLDRRPISEEDKRSVWDFVICNELCQYFIPYGVGRKGPQTLKSDFGLAGEFKAFKETLSLYDISDILILGTPSWNYILEEIEKDDDIEVFHEALGNGKPNKYGYFHRIQLDNKKINVVYAWHPSYSGFYDNGKLLEWLKKSIKKSPELNELNFIKG